MARSWQSLLFETLELGVSSAVAPELLPDNQASWGMNIDVRGGKPATRPNLRNLGNLPTGLIQGCEYFGVQGGMLVASISGVMYRLRIGATSIVVEEIPLSFRNSAIVKQVWMTQTVESLVIQDGQSNAILYNGSVASRAVTGQVPRGRQMAYGNGRLWVAVNANEVVAGDIRTNAAGSELNFTEATYLTGGGKLFFGSPITGMAFIPVTGQSDYGALLVYGARETNAIRADITTRDDWGKVPGFVTSILRSVGAAAQWSIVSVNQDLYWRDSNGGIRSIRNALADEAGPGSAPISREVSRLTDFDSQQLLEFCSGVYFNNRLLLTSSPFLLPNGGVGWKNLISLDFAPLSTMGNKSQPAYNGKWSGLNFVKLVGGEFNGKNRSFALTTDDYGNNQLWEFDSGARADLPVDCTNGTSDPQTFEYPIQCFVEYPLRNFGDSKRRKRLDRCDVWLTSVDGDVNLKVYWRSDNSVKWLEWDEASTCAQTTDPASTTPHVWKNLVSQERPQFKTFTIPDSVNEVVKYATQVGFEFQIRLVWEGRCRIHRMMLHGEYLDDPDYADRAGFSEQCVEQDVTGNQIAYAIPTDGCPAFIFRFGNNVIRRGQVIHLGNGGTTPVLRTFQLCNETNTAMVNVVVSVVSFCAGMFVLTTPPPTTIPAGQCVEFQITLDPGVECPNPTAAVEVTSSSVPVFSFTLDDESVGINPEITSQPSNTCVAPDGSASFSVTAIHGPLEYDWFESTDGGENWTELEDGGIYSGVNTSELTINPAGTSMDDYRYYCRVRNGDGSVDSDEVTLTVGNCSNTGCALVIPTYGFASPPYATLSEAQDNIANNVFGCSVFASIPAAFTPGDPMTDVSVTVNDDTLEELNILTEFAASLASGILHNVISITVPGACNATVDFNYIGFPNFSPFGRRVLLMDSDGNVIDDQSNDVDASNFFTIAIPGAGNYVLRMLSSLAISGTGSVEFNVSCDGVIVFNPVIALWDDSGTTRQLEACPKLTIPINESGEFFADLSEATAIMNAMTGNCLAYCLYQTADPGNPLESISASFAAEILTIDASEDGDNTLPLAASINLVAGAEVEIDFALTSANPGAVNGIFMIASEDGTSTGIVMVTGTGTDTMRIFPGGPNFTAGYTGKYTIQFICQGPGNVSAHLEVGSSDTMTANPVQALYNAGVDCPGRLDC